jgi:hypothetical protein
VTGAENGRAVATVNVTLSDTLTGETRPPASIRLHMMGPGDVTGLQLPAIVRTAPKPLTRDAETTKLAHIDFADIDLPWRYSHEQGPAPKPWIVLITGTTDELELVHGAVKIINPAVLAAHNLNDSRQWAHMQDDGARTIARLISPRGRTNGEKGLQPNHEYIAAVVPSYTVKGNQVLLAWEVNAGNVTRMPDGSVLPAYYAWRYWTADAGDFETIAARLHAIEVGGLGRSRLRYERVDPAEVMEIRGAITSLAATQTLKTAPIHQLTTTWPFDTEPASPAVLGNLDAINDELHDPRRDIIGLPIYGRPWIAMPEDTDWGRLLNGDPRFRGIAGLGAWLAIVAQEELVDEARKQVGALEQVAQRVRQLALGLMASRSLWNRRLPQDEVQRLWLFGPTLRRIPVSGAQEGLSAMDVVTGDGRTLSRAWFSTAARRVLRPGDGIARHAKPDAVHRRALLDEANQCPPPPVPSQAHVDGLLKQVGVRSVAELVLLEQWPEQVVQVIREIVDSGQPFDSDHAAERLYDALKDALGVPSWVYERLRDRLRPYNQQAVTQQQLEDAVRPFISTIYQLPVDAVPIDHDTRVEPIDLAIALIDNMGRPLERRCQPVDLLSLSRRVGDAINPNGDSPPALVRVKATIDGIDISNLEPPEVCIGLNYEVWKLLRDKAKSWMLPGIEELEKDAVVAMESNPAFIDALLVGLNTQFLNELHWRNMAIAPSCTPLRWFWGNFDYKTNQRVDDIRGIHLWKDTRLGDNQHQVLRAGDASGNRDLVMVFRTDLFRRYPSTLVYLTKMNDDDALKLEQPDFNSGRCIGPKIKGTITDDVTFFVFDINPSDLEQYRVVLDEPPAELRFRNDKLSGAADSAQFAADVIDTPTRVAIDGTYLEWKGIPQ